MILIHEKYLIDTMSRTTRTTSDVRDALRCVNRAVSAQELYRLLHDQGAGIGLASIYRALDGLVANGDAERIRRDAEDAYVLCPIEHHHHAICRLCGRADVLEGCMLQMSEPAMSKSGFRIDEHRAVFYGRCAQCLHGAREWSG
ncbi:MAG: Fur family transcriptional regulator [Chloroflexota bacterium]